MLLSDLGGMAFGLLCGLSTMEKLPTDFFGVDETWWTRAKQLSVRFLGVIVSIIGIIIAAIILFKGDGTTTPCPSCTWLSCVPFPPWEDLDNKWWYCDDCDRITAEIMHEPSLHLLLDCPDGTNMAVELAEGQADNRDQLEHDLPSYCREYCNEADNRRHF